MILPSLACIAFARAAPSTVAPTALGVVITLAEPGEAIAASIAGAAPLPTCPDIRRGYDQAGATGGGGPSLPAGNTTLDECCGTCASRVGVCDGWVYDPAGKQCWLLSGCKGYARSPKRIMGLIPNSPTRAPTVPRPTPAPTGGARLVAEVGSASSFRLGVRFGSPIDLDPIATPSLDPARTVAAFQRVTSWEDVDGTFAGVSTAFGALLIDTATGSWKLVDAANSTVVRGDAPALDHAFAQGRVDLAVHGSAGPPAEQVGPFNHRNNPCLSNGAMGSPHYFDAEAKLWAFIVSPWDHDPNLDAVSDGAYPQCYPVSISGVPPTKVSVFMYRYVLRESCSQFDSLPLISLPPTKAPSACADALPGRDAAGGNICRDQPAPSIATQAACCAACDASVDCEVWRFDRTPAAAQPCTLLFGVSSTVAAKDTVIGGSGVAPPPAPPAGESSTVWTALGYAADVYLAPLAAAPASAAEGAAPARSAASASIGDDAAAALYDLTGYPNMPPLYAFGFMACYWGWLNADDVTSNMTAFRTGKFPIDSFIMDYDWFNCGTSGGACADKGTDFGYSVETFPHPVQQLSEFHTKWHMKFAGIRKPRTYDHLALANKSGWLLEFSGAGVQGECSFLYRYMLRESCSQFDSLPLTSLTLSPPRIWRPRRQQLQLLAPRYARLVRPLPVRSGRAAVAPALRRALRTILNAPLSPLSRRGSCIDLHTRSFMYRYILRESCSQFDSLPLTSLTIFLTLLHRSPHAFIDLHTRPPPPLRPLFRYAKNSEHFVSDGIDFWWNDEGETQWFTYHWWNAAQKAEALAVLPHRRIWSINRACVGARDSPCCARAHAMIFSVPQPPHSL
jgi:hypothetical protein